MFLGLLLFMRFKSVSILMPDISVKKKKKTQKKQQYNDQRTQPSQTTESTSQ